MSIHHKKNERDTENLIRKHFQLLSGLKIEEQSSQNIIINNLLKSATKQPTGGNPGRPDFIISFEGNARSLIVIEAKADKNKHNSFELDKPEYYAADGALHYSKFLSREFDVLSIAVSGVKAEDLKISHYLQLKDQPKHKEVLKTNKLLDTESYLNKIKHEAVEQDLSKIFLYYKALNDKLHNYKIREDHRALLVSCILVALRQGDFKKEYSRYKNPRKLIAFLLENAKKDFAAIKNIESVEESFRFIETQEYFLQSDVLIGVINEIDKNINDFIATNRFYDALSELYIEFLRYSNSDKSLGIVLTPSHIADLSVELIGINKNSVILDSCCGTGTFLVSAMKKMIKDADGDVVLEKEIKENSVLGIEFQPHVYSLACSNMFIHGDGKSNIIKGDCFNENSHRENDGINAGLLNPPFDKASNDEFEYLLENLKYLSSNSLCACILPKKCTLSAKSIMKEYRRKLMIEHTILGVLSMPLDLFHNSKVDVSTSIFIIQAHKPHQDQKIFLALCDNDGFGKTQNKGRVDINGEWEGIMKKWINAFNEKSVIKGFSVLKKLSHEDEFNAEAYVDTNYKKLSKNYFERIVKQHVAYRIIEDQRFIPQNEKVIKDDLKLSINNWQEKTYGELFKICRGNFPSKPSLLDKEDNAENKTILIGASQNHNGSNYEYVINEPAYEAGYISVGNGGNTGTGQAFFQAIPFNAKSTTNLLQLKDANQNAFNSLFLVGLIRLEQFRYNFGKGWGIRAMEQSKILVPVDNDGNVDYTFMTDYIKSLVYSKSFEN